MLELKGHLTILDSGLISRSSPGSIELSGATLFLVLVLLFWGGAKSLGISTGPGPARLGHIGPKGGWGRARLARPKGACPVGIGIGPGPEVSEPTPDPK